MRLVLTKSWYIQFRDFFHYLDFGLTFLKIQQTYVLSLYSFTRKDFLISVNLATRYRFRLKRYMVTTERNVKTVLFLLKSTLQKSFFNSFLTYFYLLIYLIEIIFFCFNLPPHWYLIFGRYLNRYLNIVNNFSYENKTLWHFYFYYSLTLAHSKSAMMLSFTDLFIY